MGILAIIFLVAYFIWKCIWDSKEGWRDGGKAIEAREAGNRWYYTSHGNYRVSDNHKVSTYTNWDTQQWMEYDYNTKKEISLTKLIQDQITEFAKANGYPTAVEYGGRQQGRYNPNLPKGFLLQADLYKDVGTGRLYVVKDVRHFLFFQDIETGMLVRPTDDTLLVEEAAKNEGRQYTSIEKLNKIMEDFNKYAKWEINGKDGKIENALDLPGGPEVGVWDYYSKVFDYAFSPLTATRADSISREEYVRRIVRRRNRVDEEGKIIWAE